MRQDLIDALETLEPALQQLAQRRHVVEDAIRRVQRESGRASSELNLISMARVDAQIGQRLRSLGLAAVLDAHVDAAVGPDWADAIINKINALVPDA